MKKIIYLILIAVGSLAALPARAEFQLGQTNRCKIGWDEKTYLNTNFCPPLNRYFLQEQLDYSKNIDFAYDSMENTQFSHKDFTYSATCVISNEMNPLNAVQSQTAAGGSCTYNEGGFDKVNSVGWGWSGGGSCNLSNGWTITWSQWGPSGSYSETNNFDGVGCDGCQLDSGSQFFPSRFSLGLWCGEGCNYWGEPNATEITKYQKKFIWDLNIADNPYFTGHAEYKLSYQNEFTTDRLIAGFPTATAWSSGVGGASFSMPSDQSSVSMAGSRIKFSFAAPKGQEFKVPYVLHVHLDGMSTNDMPGASVAPADYYETNYFSGKGDGTTHLYPAGKGIFVRPPFGKVKNGCSDIMFGGSADLSLQGWICLPDGKDKPCNVSPLSCPSCSTGGADAITPSEIRPGMPQWWVSEPYINLWVVDKPVEYATSLGEKIAFAMTYKQHDTRPATINGRKPFLPSNGWNNNWYSYVHFAVKEGSSGGYDLGKWTATVYEPNGGENVFADDQGSDVNSGDRLLPMTGINSQVFASGFRLVHPDGSQDLYGAVTPLYPTHYTEVVAFYQDLADPLDKNVVLLWNGGDIDFGGFEGYDGGDYEAITPQESGVCTPAVGTFANPCTNAFTPGAWTTVIHSVTNYAPVEMVAGPSADALMTEHIDPQGRAVHFYYTNTGDSYQLQSVVDYDGQTTTLGYDTNGYLASVNMPYGRTALFQYAANTNNQLLSVTDAQGLTSSFTYLYQNGFLNGVTTPYDATGFSYYEHNENASTKGQQGLTRSIRVNKHDGKPDGTAEMFALFASATNGAPFSYPADQLPTPPNGKTLDNGDPTESQSAMYLRNSYHWGAKQMEQLSIQVPADLDRLTANDFRLGRLSHWKLSDDGVTVSGALSMTQEPSPDGTTPGQKTWYGGSWQVGDDWNTTLMLRRMPDGATWSQTISYNNGLLSSVYTSYANQDGNIGTRGTSYIYDPVTYAENVSGTSNSWTVLWLTSVSGPGLNQQIYSSPDQLTLTDTRVTSSGASYSATAYYPHYATLVIADNMARVFTTNYFNSRSQVTGIGTPTGLTLTNLYGGDGFLSQSIALEIKATNTYTFANGLLATRVDPNGLLTSYTWDYLNRLTGIGFPDGTCISNRYTRLDLTDRKDRLGYWTHAVFDNLRRPTSFTDRNTNTTTLGYCTCGGVASITDPLTNTTTYDRNMVGWVNSLTFADAAGNQTRRTFTRDALGRVINVTDSSNLSLTYHLNMQGLATSITSPAGTLFAATYDDADQPLTLCNAAGQWVTNSYDDAERVVSQTYGANLSRHYGYTGWLRTSAWDSLNHYTYYGYDAAGRLVATADDLYNPTHTNGLAYNPAGQLIALADGNGHVTQWNYDAYGRQLRKADGNGVLVETNAYNANGKVIAHWTPAKGRTQYTYDANGNPLTVTFSNGPNIVATYDRLNRLKTMTDAVGASAYTYQGFGAFMSALATEDGPWAADTITHTYAQRQPQTLTLAQPSGSQTETYTYDNLRRLQTLNASASGLFTYNYYGTGRQIQRLDLPGGNSIATTFDAAGQLLTTALKHGSTVLDAYTYAYDDAGRRTSVQRADNSLVNYGYDNIGQLITATGFETNGGIGLLRGNENFGYGYDGAGNLAFRTNNTLEQVFATDAANELVNISRNNNLLTVAGSLSSVPTSLTVNGVSASLYHDNTYAVTNGINIADGTNLLTAVVNGTLTSSVREVLPASVNLRSDANGNLIWDGLKAYAYDCANQLTSVTVTNGFKTEYAYDGLGRRRVRLEYAWSGNAWTKTNEVRYVWDGLQIIQERDANNNPLVTYTRGLDLSGTKQGAGGIGGLLARTDVGGSAYYHADGNGNITMLINAAGTMQAKYLYDSFGNPLGMWGTLAGANKLRFSSMEADDKLGIDLSVYRFFIPNLQRWGSRDPIGENGGINLYGYVGNDSINCVDPLGLLDYYYSDGGFFQPSGPVPYMEGDSWYGNLGAAIYNTIPVAWNGINKIFPPSDAGTSEGENYEKGNYGRMAIAGAMDTAGLIPGEGLLAKGCNRTFIKASEFAKDLKGEVLNMFRRNAANLETGQHGDIYKKAGNYLIQYANKNKEILFPEIVDDLKTMGQRLIDYGGGVNHK